jgi:hypothetical protein
MKYIKTEAGQIAFKTRSGALPTRLRSLFLLFDGKRDVTEVLQLSAGLGFSDVDITLLVDAGLLEAPSGVAPPAVDTVSTADGIPSANLQQDLAKGDAAADLAPGQRYALALPIATQLTAGLGLRGFRLNLAVEAAMGLDELIQLVPRIREAVGNDKVRPLEQALGLPHLT